MGFSNPIVGDGDTLIRDAIQSENYVANTSGWRIARIGTAEFHDTTIRGSWTVYDDSAFDADQFVSCDVTTGNKTITFGDNGGAEWRLRTSNAGKLDIRNAADNHSLQLISGEGIALVGLTSAVILDEDNGFFTVWNGVTKEGWHDFALNAGWGNAGGYSNAGYKKMPDGTVRLRGLMTSGTNADGTVIANLPAGYRPAAAKHLAASSSVGGRTPVINLQTNGNLEIFRIAGLGGNVGLDGIAFEII